MTIKFFHGKKSYFFAALYLSDIAMFAIGFVIAYLILFGEFFSILSQSFLIRIGFFTLIMLLFSNISFGLYRDKRTLFDDNEFMDLLYSNILTAFIILVFIGLFLMERGVFIAFISLTLLTSFILTCVSRFFLNKIVHLFRLAGYDTRRVFFYGMNDELIKKIRENSSLGYKIVGQSRSIEDLKASLKHVDVVFVTKEHIDDAFMSLVIKNLRVHWKIIPSAFNLIFEPVSFDEFKDVPIINVSSSINKTYAKNIKRFVDIILSATALVVLSPLFLITAILIKLFMPGPVFFRQKRLGKGLKPFTLIKFRSMVIDAEKKKDGLLRKNEVKGLFKMKDDPRITPFGKFLRRTCIDELPQIINVFNGDMSIVGPRPHLERELHNFREWRMTRFDVKPGITGLWQVNGRHELNFDKAILYDIYYIKHVSFLLDMKIIIKTLPAIIFSKGKF